MPDGMSRTRRIRASNEEIFVNYDPKTGRRFEERALRINDFCGRYGVCRATTYKLVRDGKLRLVKIGGRSLIPVDDAESLLNVGAAG